LGDTPLGGVADADMGHAGSNGLVGKPEIDHGNFREFKTVVRLESRKPVGSLGPFRSGSQLESF